LLFAFCPLISLILGGEEKCGARFQRIMSKEYDVIIVGAGPAGCSAAICLARRGYEVLLMDKARFPRDKTCGDGLSPPALEVLDRLGVGETIARLNPWRVEGIDFFSPEGQRVRAGFSHLSGKYKHGSVLPRREIDFQLWKAAQTFSNIRAIENFEGENFVYDGERVAGIHARHANSVEPFRGKVIVGADGAYSIIAKVFPSPTHGFRNCAFALRGYFHHVEGLTHHIEIHCEKSLLPGYGWVFAVGETSANVGVGISLPLLKGNDLRKLFGFFVTENPSLKERFRGAELAEGSVKGWPIPLGTFRRKRGHKNLLLVGDAGHFADVLSGEGIYFALRGGECAGEAVDAAFQTQGGAERAGEIYEKLWRRSLRAGEYAIGNLLRKSVLKEAFLNFNVRRARKNPVMARNLASILCHEKTKMRLLF
jgi:menaquinone-9 beta-reductase